MAKTLLFTGAGVAIVTPFNADGSVNYDSLRNMLEYQVEMEQTQLLFVVQQARPLHLLMKNRLVLLSLQLMLLIREFQLLLVLVVMILLMVFSFVRNVKKLVLTVF